MYARIVSGFIASDKLDEAIELWYASVIPTARQQPGFKNAPPIRRSTTRQDHLAGPVGDPGRSDRERAVEPRSSKQICQPV